jgi:hypothetical protein
MIEIIAGVYAASAFLSLTLTLLNYWATRSLLRSSQMSLLNENLGRINKFWSTSNSEIATLVRGQPQTDHRKSLQHVLWLGLLGLGSAPGFILLLIISVSLRYLARPRLEKKLLNGPLAQGPMQDARAVTDYLQSININF